MTTIKQLIVEHDPLWNIWPDNPDPTDYERIRDLRRVEQYGDITVESRFYPAYHALDVCGRNLPIKYPWIHNLQQPPDEVQRQMAFDLKEWGDGCDVILWPHARNCWPRVGESIRCLFNFAILSFADDCPGSTEIKTLPVAHHFDAYFHQMWVWDLTSGARVPDVYHQTAPRLKCYHRGQNESAGLLDQLAEIEFNPHTKADMIRAGSLPPVEIAFVGFKGSGGRGKLLEGLENHNWKGRDNKFYGVGCRDGILEGRTQAMPMGDSAPVYSNTCGAPVADLYARSLFSVNPQISSLFNARLLDLWRCGVVQLIHDPHQELRDHGFKAGAHYLPFDGTAAGAIKTMGSVRQHPDVLADIIEQAADAVEQYQTECSATACFEQIYRDGLEQIQKGRCAA